MTRIRYNRRGTNTRAPDPSPSEISAACEQIQLNWSESERHARRHWFVAKQNLQNKASPDNMSRPLEFNLTRPNVAELPGYELPTVKVREIVTGRKSA